jgi:hippurate hydrolase
LATESGARSTYWFIGGVDPALYMAALAKGTLDEEIPQNHASDFAPVPGPTIEVGVRALISAGLAWLS